jgi:hypothetical protein
MRPASTIICKIIYARGREAVYALLKCSGRTTITCHMSTRPKMVSFSILQSSNPPIYIKRSAYPRLITEWADLNLFATGNCLTCLLSTRSFGRFVSASVCLLLICSFLSYCDSLYAIDGLFHFHFQPLFLRSFMLSHHGSHVCPLPSFRSLMQSVAHSVHVQRHCFIGRGCSV